MEFLLFFGWIFLFIFAREIRGNEFIEKKIDAVTKSHQHNRFLEIEHVKSFDVVINDEMWKCDIPTSASALILTTHKGMAIEVN